MKTKQILVIMLLILLVSCASQNNADNLELKSKSENQELNQVQVIGSGIGEIPYDFTVVSTEGKAIRLRDLIKEKKPIIVYFMATWCPYCAEDYAVLSGIYGNYENNITFISISLDLSENLLELKEYQNKYPELKNMIFAPGQNQILIDYGITKTTSKYAIGKNGTIVYRSIGAADEQQWAYLFKSIT